MTSKFSPRAITYSLCGWNYKDGSVSKQFFVNLENTKQYERAICLTVLLNRPDAALEEVLEKASSLGKQLNMGSVVVKSFKVALFLVKTTDMRIYGSRLNAFWTKTRLKQKNQNQQSHLHSLLTTRIT
jgi:hypothetical protein